MSHPEALPSWGVIPSYANEPLDLGRHGTDLSGFAIARAERQPCGHDTTWPCPLHGCAECLLDRAVYEDVDELLEHEVYEALTELVETYTDCDDHEAPCQICVEILHRGRPIEHELVCEVWGCGTDYTSGKVCRRCERCLDHAELDGPCGREQWSPRLGRTVRTAVHEVFDPATRRWSS